MESRTRREREKTMHEEAIILAAEKVFSLKGFEGATMDQIAKESEFAKRTIYQYFESKEELYFSVLIKEFNILFNSITKIYETKQTGYQKAEAACDMFYRFYLENKEFFRILNYVGYVKKISHQNKKRSEFMNINDKLFQLLIDMIEEGKSDGSINHSLDSKKTAYSIIFLLVAFFSHLSVTGNSFAQYFSLNQEDLKNFTFDILLEKLKVS